jgi:ribonuclease BN (tRNA processing enzyme)
MNFAYYMRLGIGGCRGTHDAGSGNRLTGDYFEGREFGSASTSFIIESADRDERIVQDAGSGIAGINEYLLKSAGFSDAYSSPDNPGGLLAILFSHYHLDHFAFVGIPSLVYDINNNVTFVGPRLKPLNGTGTGHFEGERELTNAYCVVPQEEIGAGIKEAIEALFVGRFENDRFPVDPRWMAAADYMDFVPGNGLNIVGYKQLKVNTALMNHPRNGSVAYRFQEGNNSIVIVSDFEPDSTIDNEGRIPNVDGKADGRLLKIIDKAGLVYMDCQYEEGGSHNNYEKKKGFGHSTARKNIDLLAAIGFEGKVLFGHHDPMSSDHYLLGYEESAKRMAEEQGLDSEQISFARGGNWYTVE